MQVIFSQTSELLERQSSMASSTEEVSANNDLSTDSRQHDTTDTEQKFGMYMREFDFLEYELESLEGESVDNFNWGVRRPSLSHLDGSASSFVGGERLSLGGGSSILGGSRDGSHRAGSSRGGSSSGNVLDSLELDPSQQAMLPGQQLPSAVSPGERGASAASGSAAAGVVGPPLARSSPTKQKRGSGSASAGSASRTTPTGAGSAAGGGGGGSRSSTASATEDDTPVLGKRSAPTGSSGASSGAKGGRVPIEESSDDELVSDDVFQLQ